MKKMILCYLKENGILINRQGIPIGQDLAEAPGFTKLLQKKNAAFIAAPKALKSYLCTGFFP
ncbi:MAG: hypothetical protein HFI63_02940 [Lachnospiraceae bacterium]|nr:hypothetical protein [Lachnospiraceae bacterium]